MKEGFDDIDFVKDEPAATDVVYDYVKSTGFTTTLQLAPSKLPCHKAVVIVKLNNLKTSYGVRISWSGMH